MKLEVQNITAGYGTRLILNGIEFTVLQGSIITLLGSNGCGKSTLLKVIGRLMKPNSGLVVLDGREIHQLDTAELARKMAILPQLHHASGEITVRELVGFGRFPHRRGFGTMNEHDHEVIDDVLALTRLTELQNRRIATLSGGERQRAWIAMTLAQEPQILLLDEPTTYLDIRCQFEIIELVRDLKRRLGLTVLMVLHDLNLAARCSDQLITLKDRKICYAGTPKEILRPEILQEIFEIDAEIMTGTDGIPYFIPVGTIKQNREVIR